MLPLLRELDQLRRHCCRLPGQVELLARFGRDEPGSRYGCGDRLAREGLIGLRRGELRLCGVLLGAHPAPQVEFPARRQKGAHQPFVLRELDAGAARKGELRLQRRTGHDRERLRLFDPRRGLAQVGVVAQRFLDQGTELRIAEAGRPIGRGCGCRCGSVVVTRCGPVCRDRRVGKGVELQRLTIRRALDRAAADQAGQRQRRNAFHRMVPLPHVSAASG